MDSEELRSCVDITADQMLRCVVALRSLSVILADMQARERVPDLLSSIGCPVRVCSALSAVGITTVGQVICRTEEELLSVRDFGESSLRKLKECLSRKGWSLK